MSEFPTWFRAKHFGRNAADPYRDGQAAALRANILNSAELRRLGRAVFDVSFCLEATRVVHRELREDCGFLTCCMCMDGEGRRGDTLMLVVAVTHDDMHTAVASLVRKGYKRSDLLDPFSATIPLR